MKKKLYLMPIFMMFFIGLISCEDDYEAPKAKTLPMAGEWWIEIFDEEGNNLATYSDLAHALTTYNTSANNDTEIWLDDSEEIFPLKSKVKVNLGDLSFVPNSPVTNLYDENTNFQVVSGKIIKGAATTPNGGYKVDSIFMKVAFVSTDTIDPFEDVYLISGYKNSGWPEDRWDL
jgi:hypothetical protein